jgi:acyl-CoA thioester hydrolase
MKLPLVKTDIQIRYTDLDPLGHVSNSVYMQYFDMGRIEFFSEIAKSGEYPTNVVASIHIELIREIRLLDKVRVETWCSSIGNKSMQVEQYIYANDICATKGTLVLVGFDSKERKSVALPAHWQITDLEAAKD